MREADQRSACPVISLVIEDAERPGGVLLGVRRATPTSRRHPDVLSSPTMRVPRAFFDAALTSTGLSRALPDLGAILPVRGAAAVPIGQAMSLEEPVAFLVEGLLARKLGVGNGLTTGQVAGEARVSGLAHDVVYDPASDGSPETTLMLSVTVELQSGGDLVPAETASYSRLEWVSADRVQDAVARKDVHALVPDADLEVCLHGLCVRSAAVVIGSRC